MDAFGILHWFSIHDHHIGDTDDFVDFWYHHILFLFFTQFIMNKKIIAIGGILVFIALIYYSYNPENNHLFPKCPFLLLTNLKCPGCGSQRAIHALLHLDIQSAIKYNFLLVFSLPIIVLLIYAELNREKKYKLYAKLHQTKYILSYLFIIIIWWISRNIFNL